MPPDGSLPDGGFRTVGVDLAAQDKKTGLAVLRWNVGSVALEHLQVEAGNSEIRSAGAGAAVTGIDCPLGWPAAFTDLLLAHRAHATDPETGRDIEARRTLAFRRTDFRVHSETGRWPLSVSADLIGYPAMRAAGLLAGWDRGGKPLRRNGVDSCVAEVYPAAALSRWGLTSRGYKADPELRRTVIDGLGSLAPWLDLGDGEELCARSDDAFDAVVAGLVAGAVQLGRTRGPGPEDLVLAEEEGWVHLPDKDFLLDPWASRVGQRQVMAARPAWVPPGPSSDVTS